MGHGACEAEALRSERRRESVSSDSWRGFCNSALQLRRNVNEGTMPDSGLGSRVEESLPTKKRTSIENERKAARAARMKRRKAQCFHSCLLRSRGAGDKGSAAKGDHPAARRPGAAGAIRGRKGAGREDVLAVPRALRRGRERSAQGSPRLRTSRRQGLDMLGCRCPFRAGSRLPLYCRLRQRKASRDGLSKTGSQGTAVDLCFFMAGAWTVIMAQGSQVPNWAFQSMAAQGLEQVAQPRGRQRRPQGGRDRGRISCRGFPPPPPPPPQEGDQDRCNIREATPEEEAAQAQRNAARRRKTRPFELRCKTQRGRAAPVSWCARANCEIGGQ